MTKEATGVRAYAAMLWAHADVTRVIDKALLEQFDLSIRAYEILYFLSKAPGNRMRRVDLAAKLTLSQSGMSRCLKTLESARLVARVLSEEDIRVHFAQLTEEGKKTFRAAQRVYRQVLNEVFISHYTMDELNKLQELLDRASPNHVHQN